VLTVHVDKVKSSQILLNELQILITLKELDVSLFKVSLDLLAARQIAVGMELLQFPSHFGPPGKAPALDFSLL
jgi:hypothetical protein